MRFLPYRRQRASTGAAIGLGGAALGGALVYWLDPQQGARRRAGVRQKALHFAVEAADASRVSARDIAHRSTGLVARMRHRFADIRARMRGETVDDSVLTARVRAKLGRLCSHPSAIEVSCRDGRVELKGPILRADADRVLRGIGGVSGVRDVDDDLERHESAGRIPELQGGAPRGARPDLLHESWSPAARTLAGAAGLGLLGWSAAHRSFTGAGAGLAGAGLLLRSFTNLSAKRLVGIGAGRRAIVLQKELHVAAPVEEVFGSFSRFEDFPRIMSHVREVTRLGDSDRLWRFAMRGPAGVGAAWDAELTQYERNQVIAWKSASGSRFRNAGAIRFEPEGQGTRVRIRLSYDPPGGAIGHAFLTAMGANPRQQLDDDMMRFKSAIETGQAKRRSGEAASPVGDPAEWGRPDCD